MRQRPEPGEYGVFYQRYIDRVLDDDLLGAMRSQLDETRSVLDSISEPESLRHHPPFTWSKRQVVGHLNDAERVFGYRALCIARGDRTPLPGYDENAYMTQARFDRMALSSLVAEFQALRTGNLHLFQALDEEDWTRAGVANGTPVTVRALACILVGHARHHLAILRVRFAGAGRGLP